MSMWPDRRFRDTDSPFRIVIRVEMRSNGHSGPSEAQPILLTHLITSTNTTRLSCVKGAGESTCCAVALARRTTTAPISSHLAHVFSQTSTRDRLRPSSASVDGTAAATALSARSRQSSAGALTARPSSRNASRMCVTKVSHAAANEGRCTIFDTRKSFRIAPIDCSATTFDSSHDDESSAVLSESAAWRWHQAMTRVLVGSRVRVARACRAAGT